MVAKLWSHQTVDACATKPPARAHYVMKGQSDGALKIPSHPRNIICAVIRTPQYIQVIPIIKKPDTTLPPIPLTYPQLREPLRGMAPQLHYMQADGPARGAVR